MEENSVGCACELIRGVAHCRKLYSVSTCHVLPVFSGLIRKCYLSEEDSQLSKEDIFMCLKCFRHIEKLIRLDIGHIHIPFCATENCATVARPSLPCAGDAMCNTSSAADGSGLVHETSACIWLS